MCVCVRVCVRACVRACVCSSQIIRLNDPSNDRDPKRSEPADHEKPVSKPVEPASGSHLQPNAPWGLDRIDSRAGRNGVYNHGLALGSGAVVYILDTGERMEMKSRGGWGWG